MGATRALERRGCAQEIDFSKGVRGQSHRPGATLDLPPCLDAKLQARLAALASARGIALSTLVDELLRKDAETIEGQ